ncbi:Clavaminate synthase-like protein, partial [Acephala macrosclerotiorum]
PSFLRDACTCPLCVDPSSKQKKFQTSDIPADLEAKSVQQKPNGDVTITWNKDLPGFGSNHVSTIPAEFFTTFENRRSMRRSRLLSRPFAWNNKLIKQKFQFVDFQDYMNDEQHLWHALRSLNAYGLILLRGVPDDEHAIEKITRRIGPIRDTFYGRTWDVKSVPNAKNVAYTQQHLGLHMDLLYMHNPPGFQFLHCLKNTSPGGTSLFSDALHAARQLRDNDFKTLSQQEIAFEYRNDGQHYYKERPVLEVGKRLVYTKDGWGNEHQRPEVLNINWSPPFQANLPYQRKYQGCPLPKVLQALRAFGAAVEHSRSVYEYRLNEGECVIFNNRRILHGRTAFDSTQGERWLKGAYVDSDVLESRLRVLFEQESGKVNYF